MDIAAPLQREISHDQLAWVKNHPLFCAMRDGIDAGDILPALRKHEVHFYGAGARLLRFECKREQVFTHTQYVDKSGDKERRLRDDELNSKTLELIRHNARNHVRRTATIQDNTRGELVAVHGLFPEFAITRSAHQAGDLALIDVEARFGAGDHLPASMIDLVFLLPDHRLLFIEAKCVTNRAVRSTTIAEVARCQVPKYECHIRRDGVLDALNRSLHAQSELIGRDLGEAKGFVSRVPVLILNPSKCGLSPKSTDKWLREALANAANWSLASDSVAVIDGMLNPGEAIRKFLAKLPA